MNKNCTRLVLLFAFLFCMHTANAQVKFYAQSSEKSVPKNGVLQIDFVIENASSIKDLALPGFTHFAVLSGPNQSTSSSTINGKTITGYTISYLLQPNTNGSFSIGSASAIVNDKMMHTNVLSIKVVGAVANNNNSFLPAEEVMEDYTLKPGENSREKIKNNMMVLLDVNKTSCYEGEPIVATYKLCTRLKSESQVIKRPSLNGFSVYDMLSQENNVPTAEKINGKSFNVHVIRKIQLYALQPGSFELDAVELENTVHFLKSDNVRSNNAMQQLFDDVTNNGNWISEEINLASKPIIITVKPLPVPKPVAFNGAVGNFTIESFLKSTAPIHENELAVFSITIKGSGNLPLLATPTVNFPAGIFSDEPVVKEEVDKTVAPISGNKTFLYNLSFDKAGDYTIPAVDVSFFNSAKKTFSTISTKPFTIHVLAGKVNGKKDADKKIKPAEMPASTGFYKKILWMLPVALLIMTGLFLYTKKSSAIKKEVAQKLSVSENEMKVEILPDPEIDFFEAPKKLLNNDNSHAFYNALHHSMWKNIASILSEPNISINKNSMAEKLRRHNVAEDNITSIQTILQECEMALYMPAGAENNRQAMLSSAVALFKKINQI